MRSQFAKQSVRIFTLAYCVDYRQQRSISPNIPFRIRNRQGGHALLPQFLPLMKNRDAILYYFAAIIRRIVNFRKLKIACGILLVTP